MASPKLASDGYEISKQMKVGFWRFFVMTVSEVFVSSYSAPGQEQSSHWSGGPLRSCMTLMHWPKWLTLH
jgi:hypothetical protein